jgi:hypothetical protein
VIVVAAVAAHGVQEKRSAFVVAGLAMGGVMSPMAVQRVAEEPPFSAVAGAARVVPWGVMSSHRGSFSYDRS